MWQKFKLKSSLKSKYLSSLSELIQVCRRLKLSFLFRIVFVKCQSPKLSKRGLHFFSPPIPRKTLKMYKKQKATEQQSLQQKPNYLGIQNPSLLLILPKSTSRKVRISFLEFQRHSK